MASRAPARDLETRIGQHVDLPLGFLVPLGDAHGVGAGQHLGAAAAAEFVFFSGVVLARNAPRSVQAQVPGGAVHSELGGAVEGADHLAAGVQDLDLGLGAFAAFLAFVGLFGLLGFGLSGFPDERLAALGLRRGGFLRGGFHGTLRFLALALLVGVGVRQAGRVQRVGDQGAVRTGLAAEVGVAGEARAGALAGPVLLRVGEREEVERLLLGRPR